MKKVFALLLLLFSFSLIGCSSANRDKETEHASKSISKSSKELDAPISDNTVKTSEVQGDDLTKARLALYEAGIDSSDISDDQLLDYWQDAQTKDVDFVAYIQELGF